jgi:integrase
VDKKELEELLRTPGTLTRLLTEYDVYEHNKMADQMSRVWEPWFERSPDGKSMICVRGAKAAGAGKGDKVEDTTPEETPAPQTKTIDVVNKFLSSKRNDLAEGSLVKYSSSFKTFAKAYPYLPMTPEPIENYLAARLASSSKRYLYALLSGLYEFAHERLDIPNVMEKIKRPRKGKSKESDYLTLEQLKILLGAIQDDRERGMAWLMSGLGFRRSEVHRSNVDDVFDDKIRVHGKEAEEWLPLLPETRDLLLKQAAGRSGKQPLFVTRTTGRRVGVDQINKIVNRLFKQAGVNSVRPSPHTLRHTYCTLMQAAGCDRISVELLMRHRTQNTTDVYTHTSAEQKLELLRPKLEHFSLIRLVNGHKPSITGNNR